MAKLQIRRSSHATLPALEKAEISMVLDRKKIAFSTSGLGNRVINEVTPWEAGILFLVGDLLVKDGLIFQAAVEHTSSIWASEIANWNTVSKPGTIVTADIPTRDAVAGLDLFEGLACYVVNASVDFPGVGQGDATVLAGAALYVYDGAAWQKIAEFESLDLVINDATESLKGIVELADQAEVDAGTDAVRVVTPATLAASTLAGRVTQTESASGNQQELPGWLAGISYSGINDLSFTAGQGYAQDASWVDIAPGQTGRVANYAFDNSDGSWWYGTVPTGGTLYKLFDTGSAAMGRFTIKTGGGYSFKLIGFTAPQTYEELIPVSMTSGTFSGNVINGDHGNTTTIETSNTTSYIGYGILSLAGFTHIYEIQGEEVFDTTSEVTYVREIRGNYRGRQAITDAPITVTPTTLDETNGSVTVDATAGDKVINLPAVADALPGKIYTVKKVDASVNIVTVTPDGAETIDTAATVVLTSQNDSVSLISDGTEWHKTSEIDNGKSALVETMSAKLDTVESGSQVNIAPDNTTLDLLAPIYNAVAGTDGVANISALYPPTSGSFSFLNTGSMLDGVYSSADSAGTEYVFITGTGVYSADLDVYLVASQLITGINKIESTTTYNSTYLGEISAGEHLYTATLPAGEALGTIMLTDPTAFTVKFYDTDPRIAPVAQIKEVTKTLLEASVQATLTQADADAATLAVDTVKLATVEAGAQVNPAGDEVGISHKYVLDTSKVSLSGVQADENALWGLGYASSGAPWDGTYASYNSNSIFEFTAGNVNGPIPDGTYYLIANNNTVGFEWRDGLASSGVLFTEGPTLEDGTVVWFYEVTGGAFEMNGIRTLGNGGARLASGNPALPIYALSASTKADLDRITDPDDLTIEKVNVVLTGDLNTVTKAWIPGLVDGSLDTTSGAIFDAPGEFEFESSALVEIHDGSYGDFTLPAGKYTLALSPAGANLGYARFKLESVVVGLLTLEETIGDTDYYSYTNAADAVIDRIDIAFGNASAGKYVRFVTPKLGVKEVTQDLLSASLQADLARITDPDDLTIESGYSATLDPAKFSSTGTVEGENAQWGLPYNAAGITWTGTYLQSAANGTKFVVFAALDAPVAIPEGTYYLECDTSVNIKWETGTLHSVSFSNLGLQGNGRYLYASTVGAGQTANGVYASFGGVPTVQTRLASGDPRISVLQIKEVSEALLSTALTAKINPASRTDATATPAITAADRTVKLSYSATGAVTATVALCSTFQDGQEVVLKDIETAGVNNITVVPSGSDTIDESDGQVGNNVYVMNSDKESIRLSIDIVRNHIDIIA